MLQLSIVIPVLGQWELLEPTLVSVLANRPDDCEVLLVLNGDYDDPYHLEDEVRFIDANLGDSWSQCANVGIARSRAPLVHLLAPGVEVDEGWTQPALVCFADPRVASVSPLVVNAVEQQRVLSAGLALKLGGRIRQMAAGRTVAAALSDKSLSKTHIAPGWSAGFYRKEALEHLEVAFDPGLGQDAAPLDLALQLERLGYRCICQPATHVTARQTEEAESTSAFRQGLYAERLFLRNTPAGKWSAALAAHSIALAGEFLQNVLTTSGPARLTGRLAAWLQFGRHRSHYALVEQIGEELAANEPPSTLRLHAPSRPAPKSRIVQKRVAGG